MSTETPQAGTRSVVIERVMPHPPEKVWRALTQSAMMAEWLMPNDFEAKQGHQFKMTWSNNGYSGVIDSKVTAIEPHSKLAYTWASMGVDTLVTFTLVPEAGGTRLRMEQSGFDPANKNALGGAMHGWTGFLEKLETVVAKS
jgi:uncharacterized protein YndB with AHSA1/START domain